MLYSLVPASASGPHVARNPLATRWLACALIILITASGSVMARAMPDFAPLVERVSPAVVNIRAVGDLAGQQSEPTPEQMPELFRRFFEDPRRGQPPRGQRKFGQGSGFIISEDGYVLTNAHVVRGAGEIQVIMSDRREFEAELIGDDPRSDVALLKIDAQNLPTVELGDSDDLKVGQWALAIGNPFGFEHTATQGIISALSRSLPDENYVPFIQTDVAVNPGNSGGPLFDEEGRVIGINSQIYSRTGGYMGLSFSIPINMAMSVSDQLREQGFVSRGWLGVSIQDLDQTLAESFGMENANGALIASVMPDGPAAEAGLRSGDVILSFRGKQITRSHDLPPVVAATPAGTDANVKILRDGKPREIEVQVGSLKDDRQLASAVQKKTPQGRLGLVAGETDAEEGVLVREVNPRGAAARAGIRSGDIILSFDHTAVKSTRQLSKLVQDSPSDKPIAVLIQRDSSTQFLALTLPEA
ncbi:MAG: DegQ family serine endoprotease [Gammaproteobacteria bacterium]|nr:DegQ family serine endoprotease [Gammaproteobacteria bacterium]